ncbi:HEAT repeat domain-containing protein [Thermodesulfovibrio sp.]|uniref:HEAT repeat domain-containing protein n=1 Tax=Thermodesulfovibrio sp. TaxID=2067987 RepID=UPI0030EBD718
MAKRMIHFFCPSCWRGIPDFVIICPYCQYDLKSYQSLSYEEKLIHALKHPVKEIRRTIIYIIGLKRLEKAVSELERMIDEEEDPIILMEIANALRKIRSRKAKEVLDKMKSHKFPLIARYVEQNINHR